MVKLIPVLSHHLLLLHYNPQWFYLSGAGYPGCPEKLAVKWVNYFKVETTSHKPV